MKRATFLLFFCTLGFATGGCFPWLDGSEADAGSNAPPGTYTFCGAITATCSADYGGPASAEQYLLGEPAACAMAAAEQCPTLQAAYSDAYQSAVVACAQVFSPCDANFINCVGVRTASQPPTAMQEKVKTDFCQKFGQTDGGTTIEVLAKAACHDFFTVTPPADSGVPFDVGANSYGAGYIVLTVSDPLAAKMDDCIRQAAASAESVDGGPPNCGNCLESLQACADGIADEAVTPAGCQPEGGASPEGASMR
jgi:hypothetical protein